MGYKTAVKGNIERRERLEVRSNVNEEKDVEIRGSEEK